MMGTQVEADLAVMKDIAGAEQTKTATHVEIENAVTKFKKRKASDIARLRSEHLIFAASGL